MEKDFMSEEDIIKKYPIVQLVVDNERRASPLITQSSKATNKCVDKLMRLFREIKGIISDLPKDPSTGEIEETVMQAFIPREIILEMRKRIYFLPKTELRGLTKIVQMNQYSNRMRLTDYIDTMVYIVIIEELGDLFAPAHACVIESYVQALEDINDFYGLDGEIDINYGVVNDQIIGSDSRTYEETLDDMFYGAVGSSRVWIKRAFNDKVALRDGLESTMRTFHNVYVTQLMTRSNYSFNLAMINALRRGGVETYTYRAILDGRTSEICISLNGKVFSIEDAQVGVNMPPMHHRCRSHIEMNI